jgi:hypothetical protein
MKKQLIASLAAAMVLGVAGTSFAAANPFVDVPANNWAYDSVRSLAKAGIVDGYGDGTFKGDKVITRYEMAQIVAKAMAKSDKADAKQKAEIDKLAVEFSDELNKIGVRVATLEAKQSNLKFTGDLRVKWNNTANRADADAFKDRFRLGMTSQINDNTTLFARFVFQDDTFNQDTNQRLSNMGLTTKGLIPNTTVTIGRYDLNLSPTQNIAGTTGDIDGIQTMTKVGNFGLQAGYAQVRNTGSATAITNKIAIKNIAYGEGTYQMGKIKFNADYFKNLNAGANSGSDLTDPVVKPIYQISGGGAVYTFDSNVKLSGEYYKNNASAAKLNGESPVATIMRVTYKGANAAKPQSWGMFFEVNKFEGNSLPYALQGPWTINNYANVSTAANPMTNGLKSKVVQIDYTLAKNIIFNLDYQFDIKDAKTGVDAVSKNFARAQVNYFF